jgi:hypothetical protein
MSSITFTTAVVIRLDGLLCIASRHRVEYTSFQRTYLTHYARY